MRSKTMKVLALIYKKTGSGMSALNKTIATIDAINTAIGKTAMWLAIIMALVQFTVVIMRYVFSIGFISVQESIWYMHGMLFMMGAGYTLLNDGHVRVDVFYREASPRFKAWVDMLGSILFIMPVVIYTLWISKNYVINSWRIFEGSIEVSGLPILFILKTFIWVFAFCVAIQGIALALRGFAYLTGKTDAYSATPKGVQSAGH